MFLFKQLTHRMVIEFDSTIGHRYVPNQFARIPHERGGYFVRTNSMGLRSDTEFDSWTSDRPRVLIFGDSYTAGDGCHNDERFSDRLGRALDIDVFNFGLSGSGPDQHLLLWEKVRREIGADLVIWLITIHTIERILKSHRPTIDRLTGRPLLVPKPYFELQGENRSLVLRHVPVPSLRPKSSETEYRRLREGRAAKPRVHHLYRRPLLDPVRRFVDRHLRATKLALRSLVYRWSGVQLYEDYRDEDSPGWQLMAALIHRFHQGMQGTPLVVVPLPSYHYLVDRLKPIYQRRYDALARPQDGLHVWDVTTPLTHRSLDERDRLTFEHDGHFSPSGHRALAEILTHELDQSRLIPNPSRTGRTPREQSSPTIMSKHRRAGCRVLGVSCSATGSAAALLVDGNLAAVAEEAIFSKVQGDVSVPAQAMNYCLEEARVDPAELTAVVCTPSPYGSIERALLLFLENPSEEFWIRLLRPWITHIFDLAGRICRLLRRDRAVHAWSELRSHCAGAFLLSPYAEARILVADAGDTGTFTGFGKGTVLHGMQWSPSPISADSADRSETFSAHPLSKPLSESRLCLAGGSGLDRAIDGVRQPFGFAEVWRPHCKASLRSAIGAAADFSHNRLGTRRPSPGDVGWGAELPSGPSFSRDEIRAFLHTYALPHREIEAGDLAGVLGGLLTKGLSVGRFAGSPGNPSSRGILTHPERQEKFASAPSGARKMRQPEDPVLKGVLDQLDRGGKPAELLVAPLQTSAGTVVCTPSDAYMAFFEQDVDALVLESFLLLRKDQPSWPSRVPIETHPQEDSEADPIVRRLFAEFAPRLIEQRRQQVALATARTGNRTTTWLQEQASGTENDDSLIGDSLVAYRSRSPARVAREVLESWRLLVPSAAARKLLRELLLASQRLSSREDRS